ncbi:MAG: T4 RnlA family RNA ligase [Zavarzinella sp.]
MNQNIDLFGPEPQRVFTAESINVDAIQREIEAGYINEQHHPKLPLRILNYSQKTQFEWRWNNETMQCRGLILDRNWNIIARPFPKFFSVEQLKGVVPAEPFEVYEKLDGSLGILYFVEGEPHIASRGSFTSEQAKRATRIIQKKYAHLQLDISKTYLFEVIYPENRIVVDYGDQEDLILLAIMDTRTGTEEPLQQIGFPVVKRYDGFGHFDEILAMQNDSSEGFVVRFQSGQRVKIKFEEYKRLHRLLTGVSPRAIWDVLANGGVLADILEQVPDEFFNWVRNIESNLKAEFSRIEAIARNAMRIDGTRRELASYFQQCPYPSIMFAMLDGKDYKPQIWKLIKPAGTAFRCDDNG